MRLLTTFILFFVVLQYNNAVSGLSHLNNIVPKASYPVATQDSLTAEKQLELSDKYRFSAPEEAISYAQKAVEAAEESGNENIEIKGLYKLSWLYMDQGKQNTAKPYFEDGLEKAKEIDNQYLITEGYYLLSYFYESESDYAKAIDLLNQSLATYEQLDLEENIANCYTSLGRIHSKLGSYNLALEYSLQSLRIIEKLNNKRGLSSVKTLIGMVHLQTNRLDEAHRNFSEGLSIAQSINDRDRILVNTLNIGAVQQKRGLLDKALENYKEALALARQLNYQVEEVLLLQNIGSTLREQENHDESLSYALAALALGEEINFNISHVLNDVSETYLALQQPIKAEEFAQKAITSSKKWSDLNQLGYAYLDLANAYEQQGNYLNAYLTLQLHNSTKDSLFSLEKARQMNELEVVYETEKKEQEIDLLTLQAETAEFRRNTYLASGLALTFILLLLYLGQRYKSWKNRQLLEKEQEIAKMKSNFFSNISHEFRTPLTLISGPIELLKNDTQDENTRSQLKVMGKSADRLLSLINQLLDLSRLESGNLELTRKPTDMLTLVRGVTMSFQSLAEIEHINLAVETSLSAIEMDADREKLETILINLVNNAFAYTPNGGSITVSLDINQNDLGKPLCRIRVKDTGEGISEEDLPKVFNRFYRGNAEKNPKETGSGIGLALTKELVELHGGSIEVSSEKNKGTEFTVTIPAENVKYKETRPEWLRVTEIPLSTEAEFVGQSEPDPVIESVSRQSTDPILLLIEDNEDLLNYLKDILDNSCRVIEAADGEQGVKAALEHIPDLIISDVMMPKMDGYKVAEILKQDEKTSHIPLILLTAKASQEDKMLGLKTHADEYLTKPFKPEELRVRIQNLIESRRQLKEKYKREFMLRPDKVEAKSMVEAFLLQVREVVDQHIDDEAFTVEQLCREVGMSRSQLHRKLTALIGQSATEFMRSYRLHRAKEMISRDVASISEISYAVGYGSPSYFSKCFREEFGLTPSQVKQNIS